MKIQRGDIFLCDLNPAIGYEQKGVRPVLVLQNDTINKRLKTVMVAPATTNLKAKRFLLTVFVSSKQSGLPQDSVILLNQIRTVDKRRLKKKMGHLGTDLMNQVAQAIRLAFDL